MGFSSDVPFSKEFEPGRLDWKSRNSSSIEAGAGIVRFLRHSEKRVPPQVQPGRQSAFLQVFIKCDRNTLYLTNLSPLRTMKHSTITHIVAEDRTVRNATAANRQALTKILTLGPQLSEVRKSSFLVKGEEIKHKIVVLEKNFLWGISFRSYSEILEKNTRVPTKKCVHKVLKWDELNERWSKKRINASVFKIFL